MVKAVVSESILDRSEKKGLLQFHIKNLFDFADSPHQRIDDYPFGGGEGMILKPEPLSQAIEEIFSIYGTTDFEIVFPTPDGKKLNQNESIKLTKNKKIIFICGHYKGIDQRIRNKYVTKEISIGDYVLTGGELPALIIVDSIVRLIPGVINNIKSAKTDSFSNNLLDSPNYTRPEEFMDLIVPKNVLKIILKKN